MSAFRPPETRIPGEFYKEKEVGKRAEERKKEKKEKGRKRDGGTTKEEEEEEEDKEEEEAETDSGVEHLPRLSVSMNSIPGLPKGAKRIMPPKDTHV